MYEHYYLITCTFCEPERKEENVEAVSASFVSDGRVGWMGEVTGRELFYVSRSVQYVSLSVELNRLYGEGGPTDGRETPRERDVC